MKTHVAIAFILIAICSCNTRGKRSSLSNFVGTWKLVNATIIEKGDTTFTDYTEGKSFIKIINVSHFAFLLHDLNHGADSSAVFVAGGGRYTLNEDTYTEHLEYCTAREWEDHDFTFKVSIHNDTLTQQGTEKIERLGVDRINIEKYVRSN